MKDFNQWHAELVETAKTPKDSTTAGADNSEAARKKTKSGSQSDIGKAKGKPVADKVPVAGQDDSKDAREKTSKAK